MNEGQHSCSFSTSCGALCCFCFTNLDCTALCWCTPVMRQSTFPTYFKTAFEKKCHLWAGGMSPWQSTNLPSTDWKPSVWPHRSLESQRYEGGVKWMTGVCWLPPSSRFSEGPSQKSEVDSDRAGRSCLILAYVFIH